MNRFLRTRIAIVGLIVFAAACSSGDETAGDASASSTAAAESTTESSPAGDADASEPEPVDDPEVESTTTLPTTTLPTTTEPAADAGEADETTGDDSTAGDDVAADAEPEAPVDTEAPAAPAGLVCSAGGGSGEVTLSWPAPADPADIATVQIYLRESGGSFTRIHTYTQDQLLNAAAATWVANVFPVPFGEPFELAVTYDDAAGNESGWNPIDAWSPFAAGPCEQGAPDTPVINSAVRGGGSLEVNLRVEVTATDVVDWSAQVDQGAGFVAVDVLAVLDNGGGAYSVTIAPTDWSLPAVYRLVAIDAHGLSSGAGERDCPVPISPGDIAC